MSVFFYNFAKILLKTSDFDRREYFCDIEYSIQFVIRVIPLKTRYDSQISHWCRTYVPRTFTYEALYMIHLSIINVCNTCAHHQCV